MVTPFIGIAASLNPRRFSLGSNRRPFFLVAASSSNPSNTSSPSRRRLILLRHGDSIEARPDVKDFQRHLTPTGKSASRQLAKMLKQVDWLPETVLASTALRSRETLAAMTIELPELETMDEHLLGSFYTIGSSDGQTRAHLIDIVPQTARSATRCILLIGHNKGWSEAASEFCGQVVNLKGACAALLEAEEEGEWKTVLEGKFRLVHLLQPSVEV